MIAHTLCSVFPKLLLIFTRPLRVKFTLKKEQRWFKDMNQMWWNLNCFTTSHWPVAFDFQPSLHWRSQQLTLLSARQLWGGGGGRAETARTEETRWRGTAREQGWRSGIRSDSARSLDWPADAPERLEPAEEPPGATEMSSAPPLGPRPRPPWRRWMQPWWAGWTNCWGRPCRPGCSCPWPEPEPGRFPACSAGLLRFELGCVAAGEAGWSCWQVGERAGWEEGS